ncbi:MAG: diacylglycerol kinase family protein [Candidatus Falkowbacteria bacterium]
MNLFIYDDYLNKYKKSITNLEVELHKLNLNGKIVYLENIKNINNLINDEINNGAKTIIAVGNNSTIHKIVNAISDVDNESLKNIAFGIIPLGDNNSIAEACGIKNDRIAPEIILARRIESINIAKANDHYFVSEAYINAKGTVLNIDDFSIDPIKGGDIRIINLLSEKCSTKNINYSPKDNILNIYIKSRSRAESFLPTKSVTITNSSGEKVLIDNSVKMDTPVTISILNKNINFIVSKERNF